MAEFLDYLLAFWVVSCGLIVLLGNIYKKQQEDRQRLEETRRKRLGSYQDQFSAYPQDQWRSTQPQFSPSASNQTKSGYYSNNNNNNNNYGQATSQLASYNSTANHYGNQNVGLYDVGYHSGLSSASSPNELLYASRSGGEGAHHEASADYSSSRARSSDQAPSTIPTATGFNADCVEWVNSILYLFYTQADKYGPVIGESVYRSLNEKLSSLCSSSVELSDLTIELLSLDPTKCSAPELTNLRTETESDKSVSATCKIYNQRISFELSIKPRERFTNNPNIAAFESLTRSSSGQLYELTFENLEGKLKSVAMLNDKLIVVQFMEKPDTKISLRAKSLLGSYVQHNALISDDDLVKVILQALTQVVVDLYFGDDADFPQYRAQRAPSPYRSTLNLIKDGASEFKRQIKHDFLGALTGNQADKERKVHLKIIKATNINYNQNVTCLVELDSPYQQALSSTKQGSNPSWEEHFLFNVSDKSRELTIELWDSLNLSGEAKKQQVPAGGQQHVSPGVNKGKKWDKGELTLGNQAKFLGLARQSIEELRQNPVQRLTLMLQPRQTDPSSSQLNSLGLADPRGYLADSVGGELQLELLFIEHAAADKAGGFAGSLQNSGSASSISNQQQHQVSDVVSIERKLTPSGHVITNTITISKPAGQASSAKGDTLGRCQSPGSSVGHESELDGQPGASREDGRSGQVNEEQVEAGEGRGRSRSRSRSFLRAIKKRFSFSRARARSVGGGSLTNTPGTPVSRQESNSALASVSNLDNISIDSRPSSPDLSVARAKSVPIKRDPSEVPMIVINKGRLSDTASAYSFAHPKSQLVIECEEPLLAGRDGPSKRSLKRYYAIPAEQVGKWRKRGTKLHLFNEHQFVACHLAGSSPCHLCGKVFSRRPGKQGYKCRNCHLLSHKTCHVKVNHDCPRSAKGGLQLEYIDAEPPASLVASTSSSRSGTLPRTRPAKLAQKSVSMDTDDR